MSISCEKDLRKAIVMTIENDSRDKRGESAEFFGIQDIFPGIKATSSTKFDPGNYENSKPIILLNDAQSSMYRVDFEEMSLEINVVVPYEEPTAPESAPFTINRIITRLKSLISGNHISAWTGSGFETQTYSTNVSVETSGEIVQSERYVVSTMYVRAVFPRSINSILRR